MTSGNFHSILVDRIEINREGRQRRELVNIDVLADSIRRLGLINPVVVTREHVLVAGERRLTAVKSLGWTSVTCQYTDELDARALAAIELEENIKRVDLSWQDEVSAIRQYHALRLEEDTDWTQIDTAEALGISPQEISDKLAVAIELDAKNPRILEAPKYSVARGIVRRNEERKDEQEVAALRTSILGGKSGITVGAGSLPGVAGTVLKSGAGGSQLSPAPDDGSESILNVSFNDWAPAYSGPKFNFVHCDFPYGIDADKFNQGGAAAHGGYSDSEDTYWTLCRSLAANLDRLCTESAHIMFWFSMKFYQPTLEFFDKETDFVIDPFPLIWMKSDNVGILPDPSRGPRRVYETALLGRRGDRKVVQAVANAYAAPTVRDRHMSEKPEPVLRHFFRMLVDGHSLVLDPTAGSGSSIRAAEGMGAKLAVGCEINPEFAVRARKALIDARKLRKAS